MQPKNKHFPAHTRAVALAAALAAAFLSTEPAHAGQVRFQVQELATPGNGSGFSMAYDINNLGQVAGFVQSNTQDQGTRRAAIWNNGQLQVLQIDNARYSEARALNDLGQAVGMVDYGTFQSRAALWSGGQLSVLPGSGPLSETGDRAVDINNSGLIVGSVIAPNGYQHAAAWRNGQLSDLGASTVRADAFSAANGVNNWGQIVGTASVLGSTSGTTPLVWSSYGNGPFNVSGSYGALAINDLGQVLSTVNVGDISNHQSTPVLIQGSQVTHMLAGDAEGYFTGLNNAGQAIGVVNYTQHTLWSASGGAVDINSVLLPGSAGVQWISGINELGQMSAYSSNSKAAVLTPTGTLNYTGPDGGFFNDAASWDSGLGFSPNKFLDASIATANGERDVIGVSYELDVKSLRVGGGGGTSRLFLMEGGRINALEGTRLLAGGRLATYAGSDALYATGHLGGNLHTLAGSGIELKAGRPEDQAFDRLIVDGELQLDGGELIVTMLGAPAAQLGDSYDFLDWGSLSGHFDSLDLPALSAGLVWDTSRLYIDGVLSVAAVPEPASWALLLAGGCAVSGRLRRQARNGLR